MHANKFTFLCAIFCFSLACHADPAGEDSDPGSAESPEPRMEHVLVRPGSPIILFSQDGLEIEAPDADLFADYGDAPLRKLAAPLTCAVCDEAADRWACYGCVAESPSQSLDIEPAAAEFAVSEPDPSALGVRYCSSSYDCNPNGCYCGAGICQVNEVFPGAPPNYIPPDCSLPPRRQCSQSSDCMMGCGCSGGYCKPTSVPASQVCHLPPPDLWEIDNAPAQWKAYGGPQVGHTFHEPDDIDWIVAWFGGATNATFQTYDVTADTYLQVYEFNLQTGQPGKLVGTSDDVCYPKTFAQCMSSKVTLQVPAQSAYFAKITQNHKPEYNAYQASHPRYSFKIY